MKTLRTIFTLVALVLVSGSVMAVGNLKLHVVPREEGKAIVAISNVVESEYEVELKNERGEVVFYKRTTAPNGAYAKAYDFSLVEDGNYTLSASTDKESEVNYLAIKNGKVEVTDQKKLVEPFFTVNDKVLKLTYLNFEKDGAKLYLYDNKGNLLHSNELKPDFAVHAGLDISELNRGNYTAVLADNENSYEYEIAVD